MLKVAAGVAGCEITVGVSEITLGPAGSGNAPVPGSMKTVNFGVPLANDGDVVPISGPGRGSAVGSRTTLRVSLPLPSQRCGKVVSTRHSGSDIGLYLLVERDRLGEPQEPSNEMLMTQQMLIWIPTEHWAE